MTDKREPSLSCSTSATPPRDAVCGTCHSGFTAVTVQPISGSAFFSTSSGGAPSSVSAGRRPLDAISNGGRLSSRLHREARVPRIHDPLVSSASFGLEYGTGRSQVQHQLLAVG